MVTRQRGRQPEHADLGRRDLGAEIVCRCGHSWTVHAIGTQAGVKIRTPRFPNP